MIFAIIYGLIGFAVMVTILKVAYDRNQVSVALDGFESPIAAALVLSTIVVGIIGAWPLLVAGLIIETIVSN